MARRRQAPVVAQETPGPVLPFELTFNCSARLWEDFHANRAEWLREHGVDVDDRAAVSGVLDASRRAYGVTDSLSRARVMAEGRPLT